MWLRIISTVCFSLAPSTSVFSFFNFCGGTQTAVNGLQLLIPLTPPHGCQDYKCAPIHCVGVAEGLTFLCAKQVLDQLSYIPSPVSMYLLFFAFVFETKFLCVALAVLELALTRLASNSETCLPLPPKYGIKGVQHHHPMFLVFEEIG